MKRLVFMVIWAAIFFVLTVGAWGFAMSLAGPDMISALHQDYLDRLELIAHGTYIAMGLLGLFLGLVGKLPGTVPSR